MIRQEFLRPCAPHRSPTRAVGRVLTARMCFRQHPFLLHTIPQSVKQTFVCRLTRRPSMSLSHIDLTDPDHFNDGVPHHWFKQLRAESPVHWQAERDGAGFWAITK